MNAELYNENFNAWGKMAKDFSLPVILRLYLYLFTLLIDFNSNCTGTLTNFTTRHKNWNHYFTTTVLTGTSYLKIRIEIKPTEKHFYRASKTHDKPIFSFGKTLDHRRLFRSSIAPFGLSHRNYVRESRHESIRNRSNIGEVKNVLPVERVMCVVCVAVVFPSLLAVMPSSSGLAVEDQTRNSRDTTSR